ncbi:MAG: hypothetical protein Q9195_005842 [Heterodermia aff. obscurata]
MRTSRRLTSLIRRQPVKISQCHIHRRSIATHLYSHHAAALSVLPTSVDTSSTDFEDNARQFEDVMMRVQELHGRIEQGGSEQARQKHVARGKMLPREYVLCTTLIIRLLISCVSRITTLVDPGTAFLELSSLAGHEVYPDEEVPAGGIITGIGTVHGTQCMIVANDSTYIPFEGPPWTLPLIVE